MRGSPDARLARFHPIRFYLLRDDPLWTQAVKKHEEDMREHPELRLLGVCELLYAVHKDVGSLLHGLEEYAFTDDRMERAFGDEFGGGGAQLESAVSAWAAHGEQIFDLSSIAAMFLESDALKTPIGQLRLPYESFYVHWGTHLEVPSPMSGRFIEGCYVERIVRDKMVVFTFVSSLSRDDPWDQRSLMANVVVDSEGVHCLMASTEEDGTFAEEVLRMSEPGEYEDGQRARWERYVEAAFNMAANCLCYLSSPKAEIVNSYPSDAPERLVRQTSEGTEKERRRGHSKLGALGFRQVKLCGVDLAKKLGLRPGSREMPTHWRRGHWYPTRYGKARQSVRMDWRDGVVVNADKGSPEGGHIYKP